MTLKQFTINSEVISSGKHCRLDQKYTCFTQIQNWEVFETKLKQVKISDFLIELPIVKIPKGELEDDAFLVNISDQQQISGKLENIEKTNEIGSDKTFLGEADIFISKLGMPKGYVFINTFKGKNILGSSEFIPYKVKDLSYLKYLKYILLNRKMLLAYSALESGKTPSHKRVNPYEFLKIKIPLISKPNRDKIIAEIEPIEQKIKDLNKQIKENHEIINNVFAREFHFDLDTFNELRKIKNYNLYLSNFANNKDVRQSVKFHRESGLFVIKELKKITDKKIKHFISDPIVLGSGISPSDYDDNGDFNYISMANIKNWKFESEDSKAVSKEYSDNNKNKTVTKNDIILARSGEGTIGKVALIEDEELKGIFADFTMRIRLKNYNPLFAYYYFRTDYLQYLVEINKKGLGNNTNIFPSQIQEFPLIDITPNEQQKIVDEIKAELDKQDEVKQKIETERNKIDEIIEMAIA
ncbi:hypothetical protein ANME2D_00657 [Candidatus Methanoperedens nitroreducens]|uniref:Restriction endonuclease S subunit n=1 Tax=Candidatus Methanoperedens nitratireducens TaxID=1392998 RepID=A0A062V3C9_9EURY|nr:restriction endonuclease subunit S [Candidatus Methanoperedens nitroreducens]KCZ73586.1 hypothetical protein ANME2D_00657 [Candidatus Methanoperedens nitroreducens]MDJ1422452.1 restriction endonuclease subunit S [Candidatus Methanoperedens sp.]